MGIPKPSREIDCCWCKLGKITGMLPPCGLTQLAPSLWYDPHLGALHSHVARTITSVEVGLRVSAGGHTTGQQHCDGCDSDSSESSRTDVQKNFHRSYRPLSSGTGIYQCLFDASLV